MKEEIWTIENGKLVCTYTTYHDHTGRKEFILKRIERGVVGPEYYFYEEGTKYFLGCVNWCNLTKSYHPLYNNTKFRAYIEADLSQFNKQIHESTVL
jgi:hypothetical protein